MVPLPAPQFACSAIAVAVVDPFRVRMFAKAQGTLAKTDRLDARVLAQFAAVMDPAVRAPVPEAMQELAELVRARDSAVSEETALKNQLAAATGGFFKRQLGRRIGRLAKDIAALARSNRPFCCGLPGAIRSGITPALITFTESFDRPPAPQDANGGPLSERSRCGRPNSRNAASRTGQTCSASQRPKAWQRNR